jgi:hypothetical protein
MGRHYGSGEEIDFWLDGMAESLEVTGRKPVKVTAKLRKTWNEFGKAVHKSLKKHLSAADYATLTAYEMDDAIYSDVYATLGEHGVGSWERWDSYFGPDKNKRLTAALKKDLSKWADFTGGGKLNEAFMDAVYAASKKARSKNPKATKRVGKSKRKKRPAGARNPQNASKKRSKSRPRKQNPRPQDPRLVEAFDLYRAGLKSQSKKKLKSIPFGSLSSTDQYGYETLEWNLGHLPGGGFVKNTKKRSSARKRNPKSTKRVSSVRSLVARATK